MLIASNQSAIAMLASLRPRAVLLVWVQELVAKQQSLQHELAVAKEHWQSEEGVRIK